MEINKVEQGNYAEVVIGKCKLVPAFRGIAIKCRSFGSWKQWKQCLEKFLFYQDWAKDKKMRSG